MNANDQREWAEDDLDRQMKTLQPPGPPSDLLSRCLGTIAAGGKPCPARVRPAWKRGMRWAVSMVPLAAAVLLAVMFWGPQGERNLLAAVFQAFDRAPAYHMRVTMQLPMRECDGNDAMEIWLVRGGGRRVEARAKEKLTAVLVDNLRWKIEWNVGGRRVSAWPSEMAKGNADFPLEWMLKSREAMIQWGEKYKAKIVPEKDQLDGQEVDKITVTWPHKPAKPRQTVWFDKNSGRPLKLHDETPDGKQKFDVLIDYPSPGDVPKERFTLQVPRDAAVEVYDPQFGRQLSSAGQTGPDLRP
jgi:outer membrane lipoprotein-sorting protein